MFRNLTLVVVLCVALGACASGREGSEAAMGAFAQPAAQKEQPLAAVIVEAMAGGLVGRGIGERLDDRERRRALEAEYRALEYTPAGESVSWSSRGSSRGEVVAGSPYRVGSQNCRQYVHTVQLGDQSQAVRGTACRNADGSWTPIV